MAAFARLDSGGPSRTPTLEQHSLVSAKPALKHHQQMAFVVSAAMQAQGPIIGLPHWHSRDASAAATMTTEAS